MSNRPAWTFPVAAFLGSTLLRVWRFTWRIDERPRRFVLDRRAAAAPGTPGAIYTIWHSRILLGSATQAGLGVSVLISMHGDGEYIARTVERLGFGTIRGSSTRGGSRALLGLVETLRAGRDVALTPDGPKGPRLKAHPGCVGAASATGAPIIPVALECRTSKRLRSWDRFLLPAPFTKVAVRFGTPVLVPPDLDAAGVALWQTRVEEAMHAAHREAAAAVGRSYEVDEA
ncbi:MAG: lysophospholipid acyltransferase family protein [Planctomycetes bacterium]|nr:lysophospholipid acyltransferase family protein [Planctomycetota bacterium]